MSFNEINRGYTESQIQVPSRMERVCNSNGMRAIGLIMGVALMVLGVLAILGTHYPMGSFGALGGAFGQIGGFTSLQMGFLLFAGLLIARYSSKTPFITHAASEQKPTVIIPSTSTIQKNRLPVVPHDGADGDEGGHPSPTTSTIGRDNIQFGATNKKNNLHSGNDD